MNSKREDWKCLLLLLFGSPESSDQTNVRSAVLNTADRRTTRMDLKDGRHSENVKSLKCIMAHSNFTEIFFRGLSLQRFQPLQSHFRIQTELSLDSSNNNNNNNKIDAKHKSEMKASFS